MAQIEYWLGSVGPLVYDDTDVYEDAPINHIALRGVQMLLSTAPVEDENVVRLTDMCTASEDWLSYALMAGVN